MREEIIKWINSKLYDNILYRDIIQRFNPNLTKSIKEMALYLLSNLTSDVEIRQLSRISEIKNLFTVKDILDSFESTFLFFLVNKFDYSIKKQIINPKKSYCINNGFGFTMGFRFSEDRGNFLKILQP